GKLPPQAIEVEQAVLGALMLEKEALSQVIDLLHPDVFYVEKNRWVFEAVRLLFEKSEPVDLLTVTQELKSMGRLEEVGGAFYIADLTNRVSSSANIDYHARILLEKYILRELIHLSGDMSTEAFDDTTDVFELLDRCETRLFGIADRNIRRNGDGINDLVQKAFKQIQAVSQQADGLSGIPSGFTELDRLTSGWQRGSLNIIAARPGMGKTAFVLSLARNASVDFQKGVAFFSLEMSGIELINRLLSSETEIEGEKLKKGKLAQHEWIQLTSRTDSLTRAPLYIDDTPQLTLFELRAKCRRLKSKHDIQLIVIDYLQLMGGGSNDASGMNREQVIASISRGLKALAKELEVPVIALSQLSRQVEVRGGNKKPMLSDLRESGAIEQDADMVMFIYRPDYYNMEGEGYPDQAQIIVAKHRNGQTGEINLRFQAKYARFVNPGGPGGPADFAGDRRDPNEPNNPFRGLDRTFPSRLNEMDEGPAPY
ncbi:MAG: replicative helicase, partial [Bacteroidota bacterium]